MTIATFLIAATLAAACELPPRPIKALAIGLHRLEPDASYRDQVERARSLGANAVCFTVPIDQNSVRDATVGGWRIPLATVARALADARAAGIQTILLPYVKLAQVSDDEWRGTLQPPDWQAWFASYDARLAELGRLAAREGVAVLAVGSELCSSEKQVESWRGLIAQLRSVYPGRLTYSANWDHLDEVAFAADLDLLGMNAYFELGDSEDADVDALVRAWAPVKARVSAWAGRLGKPLFFTEVGYPSVRGGVRRPWDYTRAGGVDLAAQSRGYQAFLETWWGDPGVAGVVFYELWGEGGADDAGYSPWAKPAAGVLRAFYAAPW